MTGSASCWTPPRAAPPTTPADPVSAALAAAVTALPLLLVAMALLSVGVAVVRSLRDEAVVDALRAEVRTMGEVHQAVLEARTSSAGPPAHR